MTTYKFLRWNVFYEMDGRKSRYIREVLDDMFRRCDQNRVNIFGKRRVSSQTVGESK